MQKTYQPQLFPQTYCEYIGYLLFLTLQKSMITTQNLVQYQSEKRKPIPKHTENRKELSKCKDDNAKPIKINIASRRKPVFLNADENIKIKQNAYKPLQVLS